MTKLKLFSVTAAFLTLLSVSFSAYAQAPLTGTRIRSSGTANPRTIIQIEEPDEAAQIRRLLSQGKSDRALAMSLRYVQQVEKGGLDSQNRYFAYNALCVVYTYQGEYAKAEQECTRAVEIIPGYWSAWNNRGTARYLAGKMEEAQQDYLRALEYSGGKEEVVDILRHNLTLLDVPAQQLPE